MNAQNTAQSTILIICHGDAPRIGCLGELLQRHNLAHKICMAGLGEPMPKDPQQFAGIIIMGGAMSIYEKDHLDWLCAEMLWLENAMKRGIPVFGICLGGQMLAHIFGGDVLAGQHGQNIGFGNIALLNKDDPVFGDELSGKRVFFWHGDTYTLKNGTQLAKGDTYPQQAARYQQGVYGVQFHPETTKKQIEHWYRRDIIDAQMTTSPIAGDLGQLLVEADECLPPVHTWLQNFTGRLFLA